MKLGRQYQLRYFQPEKSLGRKSSNDREACKAVRETNAARYQLIRTEFKPRDFMGKIVAFGDSLTSALQVSLAQRWPFILAAGLGYASSDLINSGVPGDMISGMRARVTTDVLSHSPELVVFMPMTNDATNSTPMASFTADMQFIIDKIKEAGAKLVIMSPPLWRDLSVHPRFNTYLKEIERISNVNGCYFIDHHRRYAWEYMAGVPFFVSLYTDLIHQSAAGNSYIAGHCLSARNVKAFSVGENSGVSEPVPSALTERTLALADLCEFGVSSDRLSRVLAAL